MSDSTPKAIDLINQIKREIKNTLEQVSAIDVNDKTSREGGSHRVGASEVLLNKVGMLNHLMDLTRAATVYEKIDERVVEMVRAGNDMHRALTELSAGAAKDFTGPILKAWDDANRPNL